MSDRGSPSYAYVGDDDSGFFRTVHGRRLNALNTAYLLPADEDEVKVLVLWRPWIFSLSPPL
jgi:hypothetical protein